MYFLMYFVPFTIQIRYQIIKFKLQMTRSQVIATPTRPLSLNSQMERSQVINANNIARVSNIRLTHQARLYPNHTTKSVYDVQHFTEYVTGLNKDGFENFSVNIYGVGGYYVYHMDSSPQEVSQMSLGRWVV